MESVNILKDVVAYVEVRSSSDNRSAAVCRELELLGAKVATTFTDDVTHVVFKEGVKRTYLKAQKKGIPLVSVSWLESCKRNQMRMPEMEFAALIEKEPDNPFVKMKQNRRWKKMKSMQPCDFEEEVARSAERSTKRRRRIELANRFKLAEDTTPPGGSPALVLAQDTQARSSFISNSSRSSSPTLAVIPDTPSTPTMKERIEKMRREQRNLIGAGIESPRSSTLETNVLQKRLFEKLAQDLFSTEDSDDEDDNGETTARVVAKLIEGLDSQSNPSSSMGKSKDICEKLEKGVTVEECPRDKTKGDRIPQANLLKNTSSIKCLLNEEKVDQNRGHFPVECFTPQRSIPYSKRKSSRSSKENLKRIGSGSAVRESRHSTGSSSEESGVLSPVTANKDIMAGTELAVSKPVSISLGASADVNCCETPKSSKVCSKVVESAQNKTKIVQKKKLFSDSLFSMDVLPSQESSKPETTTSKEKPQTFKRKKRRNTEAAEVSFLFKDIKEKGEEKVETPRRRSQRLSLNVQAGLSSDKKWESSIRSLFNTESLASKNIDVSDSIRDTSALNGPRTRRSLGTSMSVLYGADSMVLDSTLSCKSRRSIEEFSFKPLNMKVKKSAENKTTEGKQAGKKRALKASDSSEQPEGTRQDSFQGIGQTCDALLAKKRKKSKMLPDKQKNDCSQNKESGSDTPEEKLATPCKLRHANSMIIESMTCKNVGKGRLSLIMTSLHRQEQDVVYSVVKKLGVFQIMNKVETSSTHIVCGEPRRTLNLLHAIAGGCWVLKKEWIFDSLEAGTWLREENYEMEDDFPAAKESRLKRQAMGKLYKADVFSQIGSVFVGKDCIPPRQDLVQLITLCSGKVTSSTQRASIFLGMEYIPDKIVVNPTWILDSIMKMATQATDDYVFPAPSQHREKSPEF